jgi:hypothetical protein
MALHDHVPKNDEIDHQIVQPGWLIYVPNLGHVGLCDQNWSPEF